MKGKEMRVVVKVLSDELQEVHLIPMFSASRWSNSTSYTVTAGKIKRNSVSCSWALSSIGWVPMPDCSDEWEVVVKIIDSSAKSSCTQDPNSSDSHCIDIKQHCSEYFPVIGKVLEDLKTDADWLSKYGYHSIRSMQNSWLPHLRWSTSTVKPVGECNKQAVDYYQRALAHVDFLKHFDPLASGRYGKKIIKRNGVYGNYLPNEEEILQENPYEASLLRGLSLAPPEFPKIACPWTRELPLEEMGIHKKKKLFLGSFEREAIMPKPTNCIEGLNEQAMEYQRVFAHFDSPTLDASARDGKKVIQGNDVYGNNLVRGEENLYQVPLVAPPELPKIEGPWTRELALAVMGMSASAGYTTPSVIAKAFCAMAFAATATSFWLPGTWKATVRVLTKFGAIASIGGVLAAIGYGLPIECIWVGVLAFLVPAVAVAFS